MVKDFQLMANDLKLYYKGFDVALNKGDLVDAIRYLKDIRRELNDNLDYLEAKKEGLAIQETLKNRLQESLDDYKSRVRQLEDEIKKQ